jgi:hypothetical protein
MLARRRVGGMSEDIFYFTGSMMLLTASSGTGMLSIHLVQAMLSESAVSVKTGNIVLLAQYQRPLDIAIRRGHCFEMSSQSRYGVNLEEQVGIPRSIDTAF